MTDNKTNSKKPDASQPPIIITRQANLHGEAAVRIALAIPWYKKEGPKRIQERKGDGVQKVLFDVTVPVSDWEWLSSALDAAKSMLGLHTALASKSRRVKRQAAPRVADAQQKHEEPRGSTPKPRSGARKRRVDAGGES